MIHLASTLSDDLGEAAGLVLSYLLPEWRPKAGGGKRAAGEAEAGQAAAQEEEQEQLRRPVLRIQASFRGRRERKRVDAKKQQIEAREAERWAKPAPRPGSAPSGAVPTQLALARLRAGGSKARFIASMARAVLESAGPSTQRTTPVGSSGGGPASKTARTITFSEPPAPPGGGARGAPSPRARSMQQQSWTSGRLSLTDPGMA